jgi:thiamine-phosphate pyrophosphorylase
MDNKYQEKRFPGLLLKLFLVRDKSKYFNHMRHKQKNQPPLPRLYLISNGNGNSDGGALLLEQLHLLTAFLPCIIQIREKKLEAKELMDLALKARAAKSSDKSLLLINERADIALAAGLDGVHLPEKACSAMALRTFAPGLIYGCSVHSALSLRIAEESGADYLLFGPVFDTPSKRKYGPPQGLENLEALCQATSLPVFAVGGINPENAARCIAKGAYGIAGISIFQDTTRFIKTIEQFNIYLNP